MATAAAGHLEHQADRHFAERQPFGAQLPATLCDQQPDPAHFVQRGDHREHQPHPLLRPAVVGRGAEHGADLRHEKRGVLERQAGSNANP